MSAVRHPRMEQAIVSFSRAAFGRPPVSANRMKNPLGGLVVGGRNSVFLQCLFILIYTFTTGRTALC